MENADELIRTEVEREIVSPFLRSYHERMGTESRSVALPRVGNQLPRYGASPRRPKIEVRKT